MISDFSRKAEYLLPHFALLAFGESLVQEGFDICLVRQPLFLGLLPCKSEIRVRNPIALFIVDRLEIKLFSTC